MIPRVIHYCWFGKKPLPKSVKKCIKSWKKYCPNYKIIEWNESNFPISCSSFVKDAYDNKAWAFVSDYARLKIIYENGGFYLDTDVELLKSLDELTKEKCYLPLSQDGYIATGLGFGAIKHSSAIKINLDAYETLSFNKTNLDNIACPKISNSIFPNIDKKATSVKYYDEYNTQVYPPEYFDPIAPGKSQDLSSNKTISIHHYDATWTNGRNRIKRKIVNFMGQDRINSLKNIRGNK